MAETNPTILTIEQPQPNVSVIETATNQISQMISATQSSEQANTMTPEAVTNQNPQPNISVIEAKAPIYVPEECKHKSHLQEFAQRSSLCLPSYHTFNEGSQHAPLFRSNVLLDGIWYTSPLTFPQLKVAEQYIAKVTLAEVKEKIKREGCSLISEDTMFCKLILNEYAAKMNLSRPTYTTVQSQAMLPVFKSTVLFNGVEYTGEIGRNKKDAEQSAARAAVSSILATGTGTSMVEVIQSKRKLYVALGRVQEKTGYVPAAATGEEHHHPSLMVKRRKVDAVSNAVQNAATGNLGQPSDLQASNQVHVFQKPNAGSSSVEPPIVFVPPVSDPSLVTSTSGTKSSRKSKKKAKKSMQIDPQVPGAMLPLTQVPSCQVPQRAS